LATKQDDLKTLRARNDRIAGAVERMQEKEAIESELDDVKIKLVIAEYSESVTSYQAAKLEAETCAKEVEAMRNSLEEYQTNVSAAAKVLAEATKKTKDADSKFKESTSAMEKMFENSEALESKAKEHETKILAVMKMEKARIRRIEECRTNLENGKKTMETKAAQLIERGVMNANKEIPRSIPILDELRHKAEECDTKGMMLNQEFSSLKAEGLNLHRQKKTAEMKRDKKMEELRNLDNIRSKRLHKFRTDRDPTYDAVIWLRENRSLFKYHVFEPVILEIEIVDSKYAAMIESVIPWKVQRVKMI
jgi:structural maintenance of chromosomes protein 5